MESINVKIARLLRPPPLMLLLQFAMTAACIFITSFYVNASSRNDPHTGLPLIVALTFDDGPDEPSTSIILDILKRKDMRATFFVVGDFAQKHTDILNRMIHEGHEVAFHGMRHQLMTRMSIEDVQTDFEDFGAMMSSNIPTYHVRHFRFPYGESSPEAASAARSHGLEVVGWDVDTFDWRNDSTKESIAYAIGTAPVGSIILLHDAADVRRRLGRGVEPDAAQDCRVRISALADGLDQLRNRGIHSVTLQEREHLLAGVNSTTPSAPGRPDKPLHM